MTFLELQATKHLTKLAQKSPDLRASGFLTPERIHEHQASACGFKLLWGCERVNTEITEALFALAKETHLLEKMNAMQAGEVINRIEGCESEEREVLHTAMRDFFDHPNEASATMRKS